MRRVRVTGGRGSERRGAAIAIAAVGLTLAAAPSSATAADWFVDTETGDDANLATECPQADPCKTIGPPVGLVQAGDIVKIDDSATAYQLQNLSLYNGLSLIGTNFVGGLESSDGRPVISNSGSTSDKILQVNALDTAGDVRNLRLRPNGGIGMVVNGTVGTVADNVFEDSAANADDIGVVNGGSSGLFEDNSFRDLNVGFAASAGAPTVRNNDFAGTHGGAISGAGVLVSSTGAPDVVANTIHDPGGGITDGIRIVGATADLERNEVSGHRNGVLAVNTPGVVTLSGDALVGATDSALTFEDGDDSGDTVVSATNITAVAGAGALADVVVNSADLTLDSSIVGIPGTPGMSAIGPTPSCAISFSRGQTASPGGNGCANFQTTASPAFADTGAGDFRLLAGSPMIDAGNPAAPAVAVDLDGDARAIDGDANGSVVRDIGADEFSEATQPPQPPDILAPETTITKRPKDKTKDRTPTYAFTSSEAGSTFECKVDKGGFKACKSKLTLRKLKPGKHNFQVRAIDAAGNTDATPAKDKFKLKKKKKRKKKGKKKGK